MTNWGSVPDWVSGGADVVATSLGVGAAIYAGTRRHREERALEWPRLVEAIAGMSAADVRTVIDEHPLVSEFVHRAWQTATQTVTQEKRALLAHVAARALRNPADATLVDAGPFIERVLGIIEPAELELLMTIARPRPGQGQLAGSLIEGSWTVDEIEGALPGLAELAAPMTAMLNREGLIRDSSGQLIGTLGKGPAWSTTPFARTFLDFVSPAWSRSVGAVLSVIIVPGHLRVSNVGADAATDVRLTVLAGAELDSAYLDPFDLAPGEERLLRFAVGTVTSPHQVEIDLRMVTHGATSNERRLVTQPAMNRS